MDWRCHLYIYIYIALHCAAFFRDALRLVHPALLQGQECELILFVIVFGCTVWRLSTGTLCNWCARVHALVAITYQFPFARNLSCPLQSHCDSLSLSIVTRDWFRHCDFVLCRFHWLAYAHCCEVKRVGNFLLHPPYCTYKTHKWFWWEMWY